MKPKSDLEGLFAHAGRITLEKNAPLAARMRPRTLEEYIGQSHILGPGRLLRRAIQADQLTSLIFYGPPGVGKTTLARIIAGSTAAHFAAINAVLAGVADIRKEVAEAAERLRMYAKRTILFVDEVHRFNKSQQDALLPHVENGTVVLVGATTENPYFEVNKTILSRSRVFELKPLDPDDLKAVAAQALGDPARGYGSRKVEIAPDALNHLARVANGDARALLNALELAVETTPPDEHQTVRVTLEVAEESIQRKAVLYDKEGDAHFDTISAFIKSLRGSDPDAALYWMARMVYGGEEPRFIFRRMIIFAGEDVGLADPAALPMVMAAAQAFDYVGMPEGRFHLAEACLYLALAPKSNSLFGFWDALEAVEKDRAGDVPSHLKDASRDGPGLGHGQGYQYPHAYRDHWVAQQYLPDVLQGRVFYEPGEQGFEAGLKTRVLQLREAQLAAGQEGALGLLGPLDGPSLWAEQSAPAGAGARRESEFLRRGETALGGHLAAVREAMFALAGVERGHLVLDANAGSGLLVWEAVRRAAEGGVWCLASTPAEAAALEQQAQKLDTLAAPVVLCGELNQLEPLMEARQEGRVIFDRILVRNLAGRLLPAPASGGPTGLDGAEKFRLGAERLARVLAMGGCLVWGEPVPRLGQPPLAALLADDILPGVPPHLKQVLLAAEDSLYHDSSDPLVNWDAEELAEGVERAGLRVVRREALVREVMLPVDRGLLDRWFGRTSQDGGRLSQAILANHPGEEGFSLAADGRRLLESWLGRTIRRRTVVALLKAQK